MDLLLIFLVFVRLFLKVLSCPAGSCTVFFLIKNLQDLDTAHCIIFPMCVQKILFFWTFKGLSHETRWSEKGTRGTYSLITKPRLVSHILDFKFPPWFLSYSLVRFDANRAIIFNFRYTHSNLCLKICLAQNPQFQLIGNF